MCGKKASHSQVDVQDMHLQCLIISVWFTVNNMTIQWQWILLHQGEGLDQAVKEWKRDEGENLLNPSLMLVKQWMKLYKKILIIYDENIILFKDYFIFY